MPIMDKAGLHGKLPGHTEMVTRHLSPAFVTVWDDWLQKGLSVSQSALGQHWLDTYLTSPVWRFVLSAGIADDNVWMGSMIPSVDRVGRYYPLTVAIALPTATLPAALMVEQTHCFEELETAALAGLQDGVTIESLEQLLANIPAPQAATQIQTVQWESGRPLALILRQPDQTPLSTYPHLQHSFLMQRFPSYSLWWTTGSEHVSPACLTSAFLPPPQCFTALLAGDWEQRGWSTPSAAIAPVALSVCCPELNDSVQNE